MHGMQEVMGSNPTISMNRGSCILVLDKGLEYSFLFCREEGQVGKTEAV